jgi:hypothetical protein
MKIPFPFLLATILLWGSFIAKPQSTQKLQIAEDLLQEYMEASAFQHNGQFQLNEQNTRSFKELFKQDAILVFDVPILDEATSKSMQKRYQKIVREQSMTISLYGKEVTPMKYISILETEIPSETQINFHVKPTGKWDKSRFKNENIIVYEIEKTFPTAQEIKADRQKYLVQIEISGNIALISGISANKGDVTKRNMVIQLYSNAQEIPREKQIECILEFNHPDPINDTSITISSKEGRILKDHVAITSNVKLVKAWDNEAVEYLVPEEWIQKGKKVAEQPDEGFEVNLLPSLWSGWSYTADVQGGMVSMSSVDDDNFTSGSSFSSDPGYRFGAEFLVTKYFNPKDWNRSKWLIGVGFGMNISYQRFEIYSDSFIQEGYNYIDRSGHNCMIEFQGQGFKEATLRYEIAIPVLIDFRKRLGRKTAMTLQPGISLLYPYRIEHNAEGIFSRWGYYEGWNELPYTDAPYYNYFTDEPKNYEDEERRSIQLDGQLRVNLLLNIFKKNPENSLLIGLIGSVPIISPSAYVYGQGIAQEYSGYWISTENEEYRSPVYSKEQTYQFFFGLSIGINLVKYKTR